MLFFCHWLWTCFYFLGCFQKQPFRRTKSKLSHSFFLVKQLLVLFMVKTKKGFTKSDSKKNLVLHRQLSPNVFKIGLFKYFSKFTGKQMYQNFLLTKLFYCGFYEIINLILFQRTPLGNYFWLFKWSVLSRYYNKDIKMTSIETMLVTLLRTLKLFLSFKITLGTTIQYSFSRFQKLWKGTSAAEFYYS